MQKSSSMRRALRALLTAAGVAGAAVFAATGEARAASAYIYDGQSKTPADLFNAGWDAKLSTLQFFGTVPSSTAGLGSISAILDVPLSRDFTGDAASTSQRLTVGSTYYPYAGAVQIAAGASLGIKSNKNTVANTGAALAILTGSVLRVYGDGSFVVSGNNATAADSGNTAAVHNKGGKLALDAYSVTFSSNTTAASLVTSGNVTGSVTGAGAIFNTGDSTNTGTLTRSATTGLLTFSSNTATATLTGNFKDAQSSGSVIQITAAGAIYNTGTVDLTGASFYYNTANAKDSGSYYDSGWFYINGSSNSTSAAAGALFNDGGTVTLTNATFQNNSATASATTEDHNGIAYARAGGAIYNNVGGAITLYDCNFYNNTATASFGSHGYAYSAGAIYNSGMILINVSEGKTTTFSGNTTSIYTTKYTKDSSSYYGTVYIYNAGVLDMRDPMSGDTAIINQTSGSTGVWKLAGENKFYNTQFTITAGTLQLYKASSGIAAGILTFTDANSYFTLSAGARLSVGGGNSISVASGKITIAGALEFDLASASTTVAPLTLTAASWGTEKIGAGTLYVNSAGALADGSYPLVSVNTANQIATIGDLVLDATPYSLPVRTPQGKVREYSLLADSTQKILSLKITTQNYAGAATLTWTGAETTNWESATSARNWTGNSITLSTPTFINNDSARFDDTAAAAKRNVTVAAAGVIADRVTIDTANTYTFTGGAVSATNGIVKSGAGTVAFGGTGAWSGDFELRAGALQIGTSHGFSTYAFKTVTHNGTVTLYSGTKLLFDIGYSNLADKLVATSVLFLNTGAGNITFDVSQTLIGNYTLLETTTGIIPAALLSNITTTVNGSALPSTYTADYTLSSDSRALVLAIAEKVTPPPVTPPTDDGGDSNSTDDSGTGDNTGDNTTTPPVVNPPIQTAMNESAFRPFGALPALAFAAIATEKSVLGDRFDFWRSSFAFEADALAKNNAPAANAPGADGIAEPTPVAAATENSPQPLRRSHSFWLRGNGATIDNKVAPSSPVFDTTVFGGTLGYDYSFNGEVPFLVGVAVGYNNGTAKYNSDVTAFDKTKFSSGRLGVYGGALFQKFLFLDSSLSFGYSKYEMDKNDTNGFDVAFSLRGGIVIKPLPRLHLAPFLGFDFAHAAVDGFNAFNDVVKVDDFSQNSARLKVGATLLWKPSATESNTLVAFRLAYARELCDRDVKVNATATTTGGSQRGYAPVLAANVFQAGPSVEFDLSDNAFISIGVTYEGDFKNQNAVSGSIGFRKGF
ncbi:MAG: autotransporter domain-containing protein [Puniceicoccales bacterium]|jgi:autotransporter-associated beta strand protein|nr:autotransporter domain-containing protein [Puniceicoccales bacterium]